MKKILMFLILGMFMISLISAEIFSFDNKLTYTDDYKDVKIKDLFGLGVEYADIKLTSHENLTKPIYVNSGDHVLIQEIKGLENYNNFIETPIFKNLKTGEYEEINYYWEKAIYGEVPNYIIECIKKTEILNGTIYEECSEIQNGTKQEIVSWKRYDIDNIREGENITLGLVVPYIKPMSIYDVIPIFFGKEIKEWASYTNIVVDNIDVIFISAGAITTKMSMQIKTNQETYLINVTKDALFNTATRCYIYNTSGSNTPETMLINASFVGLTADFATDELLLENGKSYFIAFDKEGASYVPSVHDPAGTAYPVADTNINWTGSYNFNTPGFETTLYRGIQSVTTGDLTSAPIVNITYPTATSYTHIITELNYTATSDGTLDSCWYSLDLGETNSTRQVCNTNWSSLSASEGSNIWTVYGNITTGGMGNTTVTFTVDSIDPTVSIDYPSSGENFNILNVNVNSTIIDTNLESCWYTNDTGVNNHTFVCGTNLTTIGWEQGNNTVYVYANDTANNWGSDNISFNVDSFNPNVTINYPTNGSSFTSANININSTIQDGNLDSCWYSNNSGVTNNTFVCGTNLTGIEWEQNSLVYIYANDSYGNWNYSSVHFTWIPYSIINESWSASALETEYETFRINITSSVGYSISSAILNYNGTKYSASSNLIAGANYSIYKSIYTPPSSRSSFGNEIRYFNWTINITEESTGATSSYLTDTQNQSVAELFFEFCGNNAKETLLNLTLNNQYNSLPINASTNATTIRAFFNYGLTENSIFKNYSMLNLSVDYSSFAYCTNTSSQDLFVNMNTEYSAVGFSPASYSISSSNMSTTDPTLLNLFLIRDSDSLEFFIIVQEDLYPITNALINIQKFFLGEGVYKSVEIKETDADGKFTSYLELDQDYRFSIVKDGTLLGVVEKKSICESAPCTLTLSITSASQEALSGLTSIYAENIAYNLSYNPLTEFVTFQFTDITGTADYFRMYVYQGFGNESSKLIYDKLLYTSSGSILWNSSGYSKGDFRVETYISRSPELFIDFITFFKNIGVELGVIGLFTAFLLVLTIIFGLSFKPAMFIMAVPLSLSLFKIVGLVSLSVTSITIIYILGGIALVFLSK